MTIETKDPTEGIRCALARIEMSIDFLTWMGVFMAVVALILACVGLSQAAWLAVQVETIEARSARLEERLRDLDGRLIGMQRQLDRLERRGEPAP